MTDHQLLLANLVVTIVGVLGALYLQHVGNKIQIRQAIAFEASSTVAAESSAAQVRLPQWPVRAIALLVLGMWFAVGYDIYDRHTAFQEQGPILMAYGGGGIVTACAGIINGAALTEYSQDYNAAIVCGFDDASIDRFQDNNITISSSHTILQGQMSVQTNFSQAMLAEYLKLRDRVRASQPTEPQPTMAEAYWFEVVLLPKDSSPANFKTLSDIEKLGGKILSRQMPSAHDTLNQMIRLAPVAQNGKAS